MPLKYIFKGCFFMDEAIRQNSNIIIENRKRVNISGVKECVSFDDETVMLETALGNLTLKGEKLHIINFDTKSGDFSLEGKIFAVAYTGNQNGGSFFGRLFK